MLWPSTVQPMCKIDGTKAYGTRCIREERELIGCDHGFLNDGDAIPGGHKIMPPKNVFPCLRFNRDNVI